MGEVTTKIILENARDAIKASCGLITENEVRKLDVIAVVDTGAMRLVIDEKTREKLGLRVEADRDAILADGSRQKSKVTEPVTVRWKDRYATGRALVLPGIKEILLGVIPLEDMDLMVNPVDNMLVGVHGDEWIEYVRGAGL